MQRKKTYGFSSSPVMPGNVDSNRSGGSGNSALRKQDR